MDKIHGCFVGAMVGDAAGATLEFYRGDITENVAWEAMKMPGGGVLDVGPGQFTDDTELAFQLAWSIISEGHYDSRTAFAFYQSWLRSNPFDVGNTCRMAFGGGSNQTYSEISQANGALMRVFPIAIYGRNMKDEDIASFARQDALLSHPNKVCQDCNAVYCVAMAYLLRCEGEGDSKKAIEHVRAFMENNNIHEDVVRWFEEAIGTDDIGSLECFRNIGWVRWAFTLAFHFLAKGSSFENAIHKTLMMGGDTDTNAAIVGALLGALWGIDGIPSDMMGPVLKFDCTDIGGEGHRRPKSYKATHFKMLCEKLAACGEGGAGVDA